MPKKNTPSEEDVTIPEVLGAGWAYVQHGMDKVIGWGIGKMRQAGEMKPKKRQGRAERVGRDILRAFGTFGDSYYKTYEHLKQRKESSKDEAGD